ncbi:PREDICTED: malate dehydrogenase, mitochondrial-like [Dinoponera quadriceps]|uniref:Malate dehydrogenase, mitochondrial n=1 Tax=Dinoponera quadriceps TaxID=609295 RepID=A0A6P3YBS4_DINQU|nr:PREDICTED: malate dehydrogenase, mitochondrial-like [Dinoponera quadriceps]
MNNYRNREHDELRYIRRCCVAIVGIGRVGKSLAHLLKMYPAGLTELRLCNRSDPEGVVEELNHIPTRLPVRGFKGTERLPLGLQGVDIVVLTAGVPRKPGMLRSHLFMGMIGTFKDKDRKRQKMSYL